MYKSPRFLTVYFKPVAFIQPLYHIILKRRRTANTDPISRTDCGSGCVPSGRLRIRSRSWGRLTVQLYIILGNPANLISYFRMYPVVLFLTIHFKTISFVDLSIRFAIHARTRAIIHTVPGTSRGAGCMPGSIYCRWCHFRGSALDLCFKIRPQRRIIHHFSRAILSFGVVVADYSVRRNTRCLQQIFHQLNRILPRCRVISV